MRIDFEARREKILRIIINAHITSGIPVSSRMVCSKYRINLSPASVRSIMADLEERGFITHLHTSAGRIPTDKGYRFYVDRLLEHVGLTPQERGAIDREYIVKRLAQEEAIRKTSKVLSDFTHYAGFVSHPQLKKSLFKRIQFAPITAHKICVVLVTNIGIMKSSVIAFDFEIDKERLRQIENFLNEHLEEVPLRQIKTRLRRMMIQERNAFFYLLKQAVELLDLSSLVEERDAFDFEGISNVLSFPEFCDARTLISLMRVMEEKMSLAEMAKDILDNVEDAEKIKILIGSENRNNPIQQCSLILTGYKIDDEPMGILGLIGPKRMNYAKSIAAVEYVSKQLSEILTKFSF